MKVTEQLQCLEQLAEQLGVKVSYESLVGPVSGTGGLCRVRGQHRLIVDRRLKPADRVQMLADALGRFDVSDVDVPAAVMTLLRGRDERRTA